MARPQQVNDKPKIKISGVRRYKIYSKIMRFEDPENRKDPPTNEFSK